jgi:hypothetical protein
MKGKHYYRGCHDELKVVVRNLQSIILWDLEVLQVHEPLNHT